MNLALSTARLDAVLHQFAAPVRSVTKLMKTSKLNPLVIRKNRNIGEYAVTQRKAAQGAPNTYYTDDIKDARNTAADLLRRRRAGQEVGFETREFGSAGLSRLNRVSKSIYKKHTKDGLGVRATNNLLRPVGIKEHVKIDSMVKRGAKGGYQRTPDFIGDSVSRKRAMTAQAVIARRNSETLKGADFRPVPVGYYQKELSETLYLRHFAVGHPSTALFRGLPEDWERRGHVKFGKDGNTLTDHPYKKAKKISREDAFNIQDGLKQNRIYDDLSPSRVRRAKAVTVAAAAGGAGYLLGKHGGKVVNAAKGLMGRTYRLRGFEDLSETLYLREFARGDQAAKFIANHSMRYLRPGSVHAGTAIENVLKKRFKPKTWGAQTIPTLRQKLADEIKHERFVDRLPKGEGRGIADAIRDIHSSPIFGTRKRPPAGAYIPAKEMSSLSLREFGSAGVKRLVRVRKGLLNQRGNQILEGLQSGALKLPGSTPAMVKGKVKLDRNEVKLKHRDYDGANRRIKKEGGFVPRWDPRAGGRKNFSEARDRDGEGRYSAGNVPGADDYAIAGAVAPKKKSALGAGLMGAAAGGAATYGALKTKTGQNLTGRAAKGLLQLKGKMVR